MNIGLHELSGSNNPETRYLIDRILERLAADEAEIHVEDTAVCERRAGKIFPLLTAARSEGSVFIDHVLSAEAPCKESSTSAIASRSMKNVAYDARMIGVVYQVASLPDSGRYMLLTKRPMYQSH
jgi:hypothetical protein